ncbi:MAG: hypothetical protein WBV39_05595 [Rudaea sp.]
MSTNAIQSSAHMEFEKASNEASELAERIGRRGREGGTRAELTSLLQAWQSAREAVRSSHERLLASSRTIFRPQITRTHAVN